MTQVTGSQTDAQRRTDGNTMDGMARTPEHAKPARRDHLWVLAVIAAAVLAEVWASWVGIGAMSGFPRIDGVPTDWVLAVAVEAYWGYALYAWLSAAPGPRSRAMAMWSCAVVFALSLVSQVSYHELTAPAGITTGKRFVIGFASALPVIILALIAVLVHLRHVDRAEAAEADERSAVQAKMGALRDDLATVRDELSAAHAERDAARQEAAEATAKADALSRKLAAKTAPAKRAKTRQNEFATAAAKRAKAEDLLRANPGMSRAEIVAQSGVSERTADRIRAEMPRQSRREASQ